MKVFSLKKKTFDGSLYSPELYPFFVLPSGNERGLDSRVAHFPSPPVAVTAHQLVFPSPPLLCPYRRKSGGSHRMVSFNGTKVEARPARRSQVDGGVRQSRRGMVRRPGAGTPASGADPPGGVVLLNPDSREANRQVLWVKLAKTEPISPVFITRLLFS